MKDHKFETSFGSMGRSFDKMFEEFDEHMGSMNVEFFSKTTEVKDLGPLPEGVVEEKVEEREVKPDGTVITRTTIRRRAK